MVDQLANPGHEGADVLAHPITTRVPFELHTTSLPGVFRPPALPADFDLRTASDAELLKQGILFRRPVASDPPAAHELWETIAGRKWEQIVPEFAVQHGTTHFLRRPPEKQTDGSFTDSAWSGAVLNGTWTGVIGAWTIPTVSVPPEPQGEEGGWHSSSWIGLDGGNSGSNDVIQAGIEQHVDANGTATYVAWYEWFAPAEPNSPPYVNQVNITNLPVKPGQQVSCFITMNNGAGHIEFGNVTTNQYVPIVLAAPPGASANGDTAEWIMEAPDFGEPISSLPRFTPVVFTGALACSSGLTTIGNPDQADIWNIVGFGKTLTSVTLGNNEVTIDFTG
jgi:hypothetical protein